MAQHPVTMDGNKPDFEDQAAQIGMYLEALRERVSEEDLDLVLRAAQDTLAAMSRPIDSMIDTHLPKRLQPEVTMLVMVMLSGTMDMHRVQIPNDNGEPTWTVVPGDVAHDPDKMNEITAFIRKVTGEQNALCAEVEGIARASGLPSGDERRSGDGGAS